MKDQQPLDRGALTAPPELAARRLLGCLLVSTVDGAMLIGRIVETEAYGDETDPASHAARLRAGRAAMARTPGHAYVCSAFGIHWTLNVVAHPVNAAGAVLIRAVEPILGVDAMRLRRRLPQSAPKMKLCRGPGNTAQAFNVTNRDDTHDLVARSRLWIADGPPPGNLVVSPRIGISRGLDRLWRFFDPASPHVSGSRRGTPIDI